MYFTVNLTWIVLVLGAVTAGLCAWKYPKSVVPLGIAIAAAEVLAGILHL